MSKANAKMPIAVQESKSAGAAGAGAAPEWAVGSLCMAKYAADGKFYPAQVTEVGPKGVKVSFTEYENEFQVCAPKDLKVFVAKGGAPAKAAAAPAKVAAAPKAAPISPKQGAKAAPLSPKQGPKAAALSPALGPKASPKHSPKFAPVDPVKQEALALLQPALLKDTAPLKFSQFVSDRGSRCLIDLGLIQVIQDAAKNKKLTVQREGAMDVLASLCSVVGRTAEAILASELPLILELLGDKERKVQTAAENAVTAFREMLGDSPSLLALFPALTQAFGATKFKTQITALNFVAHIARTLPKLVGNHMIMLVPAIEAMLHDLKEETAAAANECMKSCIDTVRNKDLDPFLPLLLHTMVHVEETAETIYRLGGTTFVATVDAGALAIVVPLLFRGFLERATAAKRMSAVIVSNMSKLVEEPADAVPFLPELLPALDKAAAEVSDPEARGVCAKAKEQLERIQTAANLRPKAITAATIKATLNRIVPEESLDLGLGALGLSVSSVSARTLAIDTASSVVNYMVESKCYDEDAWAKAVSPILQTIMAADKANAITTQLLTDASSTLAPVEAEGESDAEVLCDTKFTLAYGTKILLHNTKLKLIRGMRYGLLGGNDSGKSTLLRAISNGQVEGFPSGDQVRTVFVEADIQGEMSHLCCLDYIFFDERIKKCGATREQVRETMKTVGFSDHYCDGPVTALSGGWRMKLALARAMLQRADILLLDEPTNHLDVINVAWVENYLCSLANVTSIMVSANAGVLDKCCTHILQIEDLKLKCVKGNLSHFVSLNPKAASYFELKSTSGLVFKFPQPGFLDGVKSRGAPLMKMDQVSFTYPGNSAPTVVDIKITVSLSSRVACVGVNGAGKSTLIKLLTGELEPSTGTVWKKGAARVAYVAQHAFHHIEQHINKTPNEYIQWRYDGGQDKETLEKVSMVLSAEEEAKLKQVRLWNVVNEKTGKEETQKRVIEKLTSTRKPLKKSWEWEVKWEGLPHDQNSYIDEPRLVQWGFQKVLAALEVQILAREGMHQRALTESNVEKHLEDVGLHREFGTHHRIGALSGGQKVKVVIAAAMWMQPHILIFDEPTNYLDRESLAALSKAITEFEGGVVMITHNDAFAQMCPETWLMEKGEDGIGRLNLKGDPEWMKNANKEKVDFVMLTEMVDARGNVVKLKGKKKSEMTRKERMAYDKRKKMAEEMDDDWESAED